MEWMCRMNGTMGVMTIVGGTKKSLTNINVPIKDRTEFFGRFILFWNQALTPVLWGIDGSATFLYLLSRNSSVMVWGVLRGT